MKNPLDFNKQPPSYDCPCHFHHASLALSCLAGAPPPPRVSLATFKPAPQRTILCIMTHARNIHHDANVTAQPIQSWPTQWIGGLMGCIKNTSFSMQSWLGCAALLTRTRGAAIPLITSAVIFEKIPTDRNTAAEKMTSSAHNCRPYPFLSVQIHTIIASDRGYKRHKMT